MSDVLASPPAPTALLDPPALVCDARVLAPLPDTPPGSSGSTPSPAVDPTTVHRVTAAPALEWTDRLDHALTGFLSTWSADDLAALGEKPWRAVSAAPQDFALAVLDAVVGHLVAEVKGVVSFLGSAGDALASTGALVSCTLDYNLTSLAAYVTEPGGPAPSSLREYCPEVEPLVQAWDAVKKAVTFLAELRAEKALDEIVAFLEGLIVAGAELAASPQVKAAVFALVSDVARLGRLVGTVIGFVLWQVLSTVLTAGLGRVKELGPIGRAVAVAGEAVLDVAGPTPEEEL